MKNTSSERLVTLSFDNGPTPGITERVIDILGGRPIRSTFFPIGWKLAQPACSALARDGKSAGHWIGNHTLSHSVPLGERPDPGYAEREIGGAQDVIGTLAHPDKLFPPYGCGGQIGRHLLSQAAASVLRAGHHRKVLWSGTPGHWYDPDGWVDRCLHNVAALYWSVVVLHDIEEACLGRLRDFLRNWMHWGS